MASPAPPVLRAHPANRSAGQALAEFALVAPIFFFVMLVLIELGRAVFYTQVLDSAARDGARYGVVHGFNANMLGPSGPTGEVGNPNTYDGDGTTYLIPYVKDRAFGVGNTTGLIVHNKWCNPVAKEAGASQCYDDLPCSQWTDPAFDLSPPNPEGPGLGDGTNKRGQIVTVCVSYTYQSLIGTFVPIPDFTATGRASLVVNN